MFYSYRDWARLLLLHGTLPAHCRRHVVQRITRRASASVFFCPNFLYSASLRPSLQTRVIFTSALSCPVDHASLSVEILIGHTFPVPPPARNTRSAKLRPHAYAGARVLADDWSSHRVYSVFNSSLYHRKSGVSIDRNSSSTRALTHQPLSREEVRKWQAQVKCISLLNEVDVSDIPMLGFDRDSDEGRNVCPSKRVQVMGEGSAYFRAGY